MTISPLPDFQRAYPPAVPSPGTAFWLPFQQQDLLVHEVGGHVSLLRGPVETPPTPTGEAPLYLGTLEGIACLAYPVAEGADTVLADQIALGLRPLLGRLAPAEAALAGYAAQLLYWRRTSRFCPVSGHPMEDRGHDWGRHCPHCGHTAYPHISPAVLALVHDGSRLLLVHKPGWSAMHSIVAGFVEPHESLEDCVRREVREEVGLEVDDLVYHGSQPWPFPHQLMVGFTARYVSGAIALEEAELDGGAWFQADALPDLPPSSSLSRQLIDQWRDEVLRS